MNKKRQIVQQRKYSNISRAPNIADRRNMMDF